MSRTPKECREARAGLTALRDVGPIERSRHELHLRRCAICREAMAGLRAIESHKTNVSEMTTAQLERIYDRLIPIAHEVSREQAQRATWSFRPSFLRWALVASSAAVAIAAIVLLAWRPSHAPSIAAPAFEAVTDIAETPDETLAGIAVDNTGYIDRLEGAVVISDLDDALDNGRFSLSSPLSIRQENTARSNFRVGHYARLAVIDQADLSVVDSSSEFIAVHLNKGKLAVDFDGSWGKRFEVHTPDVIVRVKGTVFTVEVFDAQSTRVGVVEGRVEVLPIAVPFSHPIEVSAGEMLVLPGEGRPVLLEPEPRALAGEARIETESPLAFGGRIVQFATSPERVKVEVDNRFAGYTPLVIRLPYGPLDYRLSAPGMEAVEARLHHEQVGELVEVGMHPAVHYQPIVARDPKRKARRAASRQPMEQSVASLMARARAALSAGDVDYSAKLLHQAARDLKGDDLVTALSLLAECYSAAGNYTKAADTFDRVASLVPGTKIAQNSRYEVGRLAMDHIGDYNRARNAFTAYIASPFGGELKETAYFSLCELYGREGVPRNSLQCFNDFLRIYPGSYRQPRAQLWRGVLLQEVEQRWSDAERDLLSFIRAKPRHPRCEEARYRIALGRYHQGDGRGALAMLDEYLQLYPTGQYRVRVERLRRDLLRLTSRKTSAK
ncbi:MAG: tetratricopeptide repeat protein [Proteobacteria bacterium]|nr:tetratricopeptide repeat protein [Pseudomonadota bacterium]